MAGQDISILSFAARSAFSASVSGRDSTDSFCSIEFLSRSSNDSGFEEPDEELRQALQDSHPGVEVSGVLARQLPDELKRLGIGKVDRVLSTVPWTLFPEQVMERELDGVEAILAPGGRFVTLAYIHTHAMKSSKRLEGSLRRRFATVTQSGVVWRNVPPGRWLVAESPRREL